MTLSYYAPDLWNKLPEDLKSAQTVSTFKSGLKNIVTVVNSAYLLFETNFFAFLSPNFIVLYVINVLLLLILMFM